MAAGSPSVVCTHVYQCVTVMTHSTVATLAAHNLLIHSSCTHYNTLLIGDLNHSISDNRSSSRAEFNVTLDT